MENNEELEGLSEWGKDLLKNYFAKESVKNIGKFTLKGKKGLFFTWSQLEDVLYDAYRDGYDEACEDATRYI